MTEKPATTKRKTTPTKPSTAVRKSARKTTPTKPSTAVRKSAPVKPVVAKPASAKVFISAKPEKKNKKSKKTSGKAENKKKVVRDSFTMPQNDYAKIAELKQVCLKVGVHVKKSELLRAGLHALGKLSAPQLKQAIAQVEQTKKGQTKKS